MRRRHQLFLPPHNGRIFRKCPMLSPQEPPSRLSLSSLKLSSSTISPGSSAMAPKPTYLSEERSCYMMKRSALGRYFWLSTSHVNLIECYRSSKSFLNVATRYIPDQLSAGIEVLSFWFFIQGTRSKNCKPSQTSAPHHHRPSMSSDSSFP